MPVSLLIGFYDMKQNQNLDAENMNSRAKKIHFNVVLPYFELPITVFEVITVLPILAPNFFI